MKLSTSIDWSRYRLTPFRIIAIFALMLVMEAGVSVAQFSSAREGVLPGGAAVGGDFIAFYAAGHAALEGDAAATYTRETFEEKLKEVGPPLERFGLTWQYPPTYFFAVIPFALLGFIPGYLLWTGGTALGFFAALRGAGYRGLILFAIFAAPATFQAAITGQNGFLTAALITLAALYPDKRPVVAGLAAALLTVKPQLGLLIPIAYLAGGCWRAFFTAAIGSVALALASYGAFGAETWAAFAEGARAASDNLAAGLMPIYKMGTPYSAARYAGLPAEIASVFQIVFALGGAALVGVVWRRVREADLRAAVLASCVFLAAPYAYYYEFVILALPAAVLAKRGMEHGWLRFEAVALSLMFALPLFTTSSSHEGGISLGFIIVLITVANVIRRVAHEEPDALRASARKVEAGFRQADATN